MAIIATLSRSSVSELDHTQGEMGGKSRPRSRASHWRFSALPAPQGQDIPRPALAGAINVHGAGGQL